MDKGLKKVLLGDPVKINKKVRTILHDKLKVRPRQWHTFEEKVPMTGFKKRFFVDRKDNKFEITYKADSGYVLFIYNKEKIRLTKVENNIIMKYCEELTFKR